MTATAPVSINDLKQQQQPREARLPVIAPGFQDLQSFELLQRIAKMFCQSPLVPKEYQGPEGLPSMVIVLNMAHRMQADPLMIAQSLYVVHGRPSWSAQFLIAAFNRCGRYSAMRYEWQHQRGNKEWGCRAWAVELATGDRIQGPLVTMATAEAEGWVNRSGSKWKTIPELMLTYRAAAWMVRTNAPEIAMGLPTTDESEDMITLSREQYSVERVRAGEHAGTPVPEKPAEEPPAKSATIDTETGEVTKPKRPPKEDDAAPTYAMVADQLNRAATFDALNEVRNSIRSVKDPAHRRDLNLIAAEREKAISELPQ